MKTNLLRLLAFALALAMTSAAAYAQGTNGVVASIPYNFTAADTPMPAGDYRVISVDNGATVTIQQLDGPNRATVSAQLGRGDSVPSVAKLLFHRYGQRYFLSQVLNADSETTFKISRSQAEIELLREHVSPAATEVIAQKQ